MKNIKQYVAAFAIALMTGFGVFSVVTAINAQTQTSQEKQNVQKEQKDSKDEMNESENNDTDEQAEQAALAKEASITREQAESIALGKVQGEIVEGELEREEGRLIYSFDIQKTDKSMFDVEVDANTGEVLKTQPDDDDGEDEDEDQAEQAALAKEASITRKQAESIALKKVQGEIVEGELEREEGRLIYSFEIQKTDKSMFDVEVDANTGEVLKAQADIDDDGKDEGSEPDSR